jgi:hypothetical protein
MIKLAVLILLAAATTVAAEPDLVSLAMPEARLLVGINLARVKKTPFGRLAVSEFASSQDKGFDDFVKTSGFDPTVNLDEILVAKPDAGDHILVFGRGSFDAERIIGTARNAGSRVSTYEGLDVIQGEGASIAFFSNSLAVLGDPGSLESAIGRRAAATGVPPDLAAKAASASAAYDVWFVTDMPLSDLVPEQNSGPVKNDALKSILKSSGGAKFGDLVTFTAELTTATPKDAASLAEALQFLGLLLTKPPSTGSSNVTTDGAVVKFSMSLPEDQVEWFFKQLLAKQAGN